MKPQPQFIWDSIPDGVLLVSTDLKLLYFNASSTALLSQRLCQENLGKPLAEVLSENLCLRSLNSLIEEAIKEGINKKKIVFSPAGPDRVRALEFRVFPNIKAESMGGRSNCIFIRDITNEYKNETILYRAEKIDALSAVVSGVAHEINNPLASLSNAVYLLKKVVPSNEKIDELVKILTNSVSRIEDVIGELNTLGRFNRCNSGKFSPSMALNEAIRLFKYQIGSKNIEIQYNNNLSKEVTIEGEFAGFVQMIMNLLVNSYQAIDENGKITINLEFETNSDSFVRISVEDDGCGIQDDQLSSIFDPFITDQAKWQGRGLGLAVVYRIVRRFKGSIEAQNNPGRGSRFIVTLPVKK